MASKIRIKTSELQSQSVKLTEYSEELYDLYKRTKKTLNSINSTMSGKFVANMSLKSSGLLQQMLNVKNQLKIAGLIADRCATSYENADTVIRKNIQGLSEKTISTPTSTQHIQRYEEEDLQAVSGVAQIEDKCTSCALTTLIRRRQVVDGQDPSATYEQIRSYLNGSFRWKNKETDTIPYSTSYISKASILKSNDSVQDYIVKMLDEHPEGVEIYCSYGSSGKHAVVISDYEVQPDGTIKFYAYDPAGTGSGSRTERIPLEDTWLCKKCGGSVDKVFNNLDKLLYIN